MSNSVWDDDFSQSEAVVRNLFLTPSSSLHLKESIKSGNAAEKRFIELLTFI